VGTRAGLDAVVKKKIPSPSHEYHEKAIRTLLKLLFMGNW
jgi:hypothetical protein